jgi:aldehyde:ferredoxin oxidoreductase
VLGTIVGARHSHNDNAGYDVDQRILRQELKPNEVVDALIAESEWRYVLTSLVICLFARRVYSEKRVVDALKAVGVERAVKDLKRLGAEIYRKAFDYKFREGFDFHKIKVPKRVFESPTATGKLEESVLRIMLAEYVKKEFNVSMKESGS